MLNDWKVVASLSVLSVHTLKLVIQKYPPSQIPIAVILRGVLNDPKEMMLVCDDIILLLFIRIMLYLWLVPEK